MMGIAAMRPNVSVLGFRKVSIIFCLMGMDSFKLPLAD